MGRCVTVGEHRNPTMHKPINKIIQPKEPLMKIRTYCTAWSDHARWYKEWVLPSIQPSIDRLRAEGCQVDHSFYPNCEYKEKRDHSDGLCQNFINCMSQCIKNNEYLFLLMPDTIWGSESMYNICMYGKDQNAYIALPHLRYNREDFNCALPLPNRELLQYFWKIPHQTSLNANVDVQPNLANTRQALFGVGEYTVCNHYYPTIYFWKPSGEDIECWRRRNVNQGWINFDTHFLSWATETQRVRVIGSSDFAVCFELEDRERHNSALNGQGRNMPTVIQGRHYAPRLYNTAYIYNIPLHKMGKP